MDKCTRCFYEDSVDIRAVKLEAAENAYGQLMNETGNVPKSGEKVAVIGGGPAGLSAANFLARAGRPVTIFDRNNDLGGIVRHVIPDFRISGEAIDNDVALLRAMGVEVRLNCELGAAGAAIVENGKWKVERDGGNEAEAARVFSIDDLREEGFTTFIIATGAWKPGRLGLESGDTVDALEFLERMKDAPETVSPGENVVVIGGGNTAMDTARAAKRAAGVKKVSLVYRRTRRFMPADAEELALAIDDGVEFRELLAPLSLHSGVLTCAQMELGAPDATGRRSPAPTGKTVEIPADTVISAIGNNVDAELLKQIGIAVDGRGRAVFNSDTMETGLPGVYIAGDAARGPATVAEAIADAIKIAAAIAESSFDRFEGLNVNTEVKIAEGKKGILYTDRAAVCEPERCLECATICECCVDVCPNRANIAVSVDGRPQIIHIDYLCNECGNCEAFCPYSSAPYLDKLTLFDCYESFENSKNAGFLPLGDDSAYIRLDGEASIHCDRSRLPEGVWDLVQESMKGACYYDIQDGAHKP